MKKKQKMVSYDRLTVEKLNSDRPEKTGQKACDKTTNQKEIK